jgi:hypothetical protein
MSELNNINIEPLKTYSIEGTDLILKSILRYVAEGTYMDIGANHPIIYNNTYLSYTIGWTGLAIDGQAKFSSLWREKRPKDLFLNCIVSDTEKEVVLNVFSNDSMASCDSETVFRYSQRFENRDIEKINSTSRTIFDVWSNQINGEVHLMSIDIEGEELNAIKGANLVTFRPGVISVEIKNLSLYHPLKDPIVRALADSGYFLIAKTPLDCIFIDPLKDYLRWTPPL